jgi:hypothetical protein
VAAGAVVEEFVLAFDEHPLTRARTAIADSATRRLRLRARRWGPTHKELLKKRRLPQVADVVQ